MNKKYCCVVIRIWYVDGLFCERVRKNMKSGIELINTLNLEKVEEIKLYNFRCTKDFYDKIPDKK